MKVEIDKTTMQKIKEEMERGEYLYRSISSFVRVAIWSYLTELENEREAENGF